jgi:hypothetical protein
MKNIHQKDIFNFDYHSPVGVVLYNFASNDFRGVCSNEKRERYEASYYILNHSLVYPISKQGR